MENTKKIIVAFLVIFFLFISCKKNLKIEQQIIVKDSKLISKDTTGKYILKLIELGGYKEVKKVLNPKDSVFYNTIDIIDLSTFQSLQNTKEYKEKVTLNNVSSVDNYYIDKQYVYIYIYMDFEIENPLFFIAGSSEDFEILGGNYVRVGNKIYCSGKELKNVDIDDFSIIYLPIEKSEKYYSRGIDNNYIYSCDNFIKKETFLRDFPMDASILEKYFGKTKPQK